MKKRKVLVIKKDNAGVWSALYQGYIVEVAGGWVRIKEHFWSRSRWLPSTSDMISVIDIRETNINTYLEPIKQNKEPVGFKQKK